MKLDFNYGKQQLSFQIPDENIAATLMPRNALSGLRNEDEVLRSLANPIGSPALCELVKPGQKIVIITSDITRPLPSYMVLPPLLKELAECGIPNSDITVIFALGCHRGHTAEEQRALVGDFVFDNYRCIDSDPADCVHLGTTTLGTPVDIFKTAAEADIRIGVGNLDYHYFVGYSGGMKAIMPGVSTRAAIQSNHSRMTEPDAVAGQLDGNPVRGDIDEAAEICPLHFIVNVVLNAKKEVIASFSGNYKAAHRAGCEYLDSIYKFEIAEEAPLVITSAGGYPKDINIYQAQKALDNARQAVRKGGIIIWVARCQEGFGEGVFEQWMTTIPTIEETIARIEQQFELGGHKAAAIAMTLQKATVYLVSDLDPDLVRRLHMHPFEDIEKALNQARVVLGEDTKAILMPYGGATLPVAINKKQEEKL